MFSSAGSAEPPTGQATSTSVTASGWPTTPRGRADWPGDLERWAKEQLTLPALWRSWSGVLIRPAEATAPVGIRVGSRSFVVEWLLIGLAVFGFCGAFLNLAPTAALPGNESQVFQTIGWVLVNGLKSGALPLWNPYIRSGVPFAGDPMLYIFNPLVSLPLLWLGVLDGFKLALFLSFLAAAWGMWYLGKVLGFSAPARLWTALMFAFAGPAVARFYQGQYLFVFGFAWIPWAMAGILAALRTRRRRHTALALVALALLFFSGNVYYAYYLLVLVILLSPCLVLSRRPALHIDWRRVQILALLGVVAAGLIAIQFLPLAEFWPRITKATNRDLTDSQTFQQVLLDYTSSDPNRPDAVATTLTREEFYAYIGWWPFIALALLPLALWKRERRPILLFGLMVVLVFLWIDVRDMPWRGLYLSLPVLYQFRYPTRMLMYGAFALIALAGLALDTAWLAVWPLARRMLAPGKAPSSAKSVGGALPAAAVGVAGVLLGFMAWSVNDIYQTNRSAILRNDAFLAADHAASWLRQHDPSVYFVGDFNSWHQAWLSNGLRYLNAWYHYEDIRRLDGMLNIRQVEARPNYWALSSDRQVSPDMGADPVAVQTIESVTLYQMPHSLPYAFLVADALLKVQDQSELRRDDVTALAPYIPDPNRIELIAQAASGESLVALTTNYPGWRLTVDGRSAPLQNVGGYLAAEAQPGTHQYVFSYQPTSFYLGLFISLLCLTLTLYLLLSDLPFRLGVVLAGLRVTSQWPMWRRLKQIGMGGAPWSADVFGLRIEITRARARPVARAAVLGGVLFGLSLGIYAITRLWALDRFPIFFFADETANPLFAIGLIARGFRDASGNWFPLYFDAAANRWTPLLSVYVHAVTLLLFGKSLFVTRATSAVFSLLAAASVGLILKQVFKLRFWWVGALLLGLTPAWFLHSRTAFETVIMVSFFAAFLLCYMLYRARSPRYLYAALVLGAAAFYTYSNGQSLMAAMGVLLLISDWRYHWEQRRIVARGLALGLLLILPLLIFRIQHPSAFGDTLRTIDSYLTQNITIAEKVQLIAQTYFYALSPQYLFLPNDHDLPRHTMLGYGHMGLALLPLVLVGLAISLWRWRSSPHRAVLLSALAAPVGAALVGVGITRVLALVIPTSLLAGLGLNAILEWLSGRLAKWQPLSARAAGLVSAAAFVLLAWASLGMLRDALTNGPLWYHDYGLYGMQYGAEQLFGEAIPAELAADPNVTLMVSSTWANGTDEFVTFFLKPAQQARIMIRDLDYYTFSQNDLTNAVLVMTPGEYQAAVADKKFKSVQVQRILPYPDGTPGFYFARLTYADDVAAIFAAEEADRQKPVEESFVLDGQTVTVRHSQFDAGQLRDMFDGDRFTLARGQEANPLMVELVFPQPRNLTGLTLDLGAMDYFSVTVTLTTADSAVPVVFSQPPYQHLPADPHVTLDLSTIQGGAPVPVKTLRLEIKDLLAGRTAHIHVREIGLLPKP
jgi:hypothetical protein